MISTPYRGGFFLTGAGVDSLLPVGEQADRMSKMFLFFYGLGRD